MLRFVKSAAAVILAIVLIVVGWPFVLAIVAIVAGTYGARKWRAWRAVARFRREWHPRGKDVLIVYSNSPHWQRHVETLWLQKWGERAVVLNWSARKEWEESGSPEVALFKAFAGTREFNPLAIVVPRTGAARVVRFWRAFRDFKHGRDQALVSAEGQLEAALAEANIEKSRRHANP